MAYHFTNHFTRSEADSLIPHIRELFLEVRLLLEPTDEDGAHHAGGNAPGAGAHKQHFNGANSDKSTPPSPYRAWSREKRREAAYRLLNALQVKGIVIQDVERGLIDFPAIVDGQEVFLCYELSDGQTISWFHELDAGYAGRKKLPESR